MQVSILSERRVFRPYGLAGGEDAQCGQNIWVRKVSRNGETPANELEERYINLGAKNTANMQKGDRIIIMTPGGGGWGKVGDESRVIRSRDVQAAWRKGSLASRQETQETSVYFVTFSLLIS